MIRPHPTRLVLYAFAALGTTFVVSGARAHPQHTHVSSDDVPRPRAVVPDPPIQAPRRRGSPTKNRKRTSDLHGPIHNTHTPVQDGGYTKHRGNGRGAWCAENGH